MQSIKKIIYILDKKQRVSLVVLFIAICVSAILETVGITILIPFITAILDPKELLQNKWLKPFIQIFHIEESNQLVIFLTVIVIFVYILKNIYLLFVNKLQYRFIFNNQQRLSQRMLKNYLSESYLFHTTHNSAELRNNISVDIDTFFVTLLNMLLLLTELMISSSLVIAIFVIDKSMTLGVLVLAGGVLLIFIKLYKSKVKKFGEIRRKNGIEMGKWLDQAFGGIKEIKILNCESFFLKAYEQSNTEYIKSRKKYMFYSATPKPVLETISVIALLSIVILKISRGVAVEYFLVTLSVFVGAAFKLLPSVSKAVSYLSTIMFNKASIDAVFKDIKEIEEQQKERRELLINNCYESTFERNIRIKNVSFRYSKTEEYVLKDVNITIPKNKAVAFVGPSGSGKTTLADIILGILQPDAGEILADDKNIQENLLGWQRKLGYISQTIYLIDDTIRNNIAFGIPKDQIDDERVWKALEEAQLKEYVENLESGLDTTMGERGVRLSGGQRQRIGIARALYRNSEVLVLDEATSALDNETEKAVMEAIDTLNGKKTLIIIAHRLSTIENCDLVFEVKDGQVEKVREKANGTSIS